jgi:hypothetical protein
MQQLPGLPLSAQAPGERLGAGSAGAPETASRGCTGTRARGCSKRVHTGMGIAAGQQAAKRRLIMPGAQPYDRTHLHTHPATSLLHTA